VRFDHLPAAHRQETNFNIGVAIGFAGRVLSMRRLSPLTVPRRKKPATHTQDSRSKS
jgi:hypothetical protein